MKNCWQTNINVKCIDIIRKLATKWEPAMKASFIRFHIWTKDIEISSFERNWDYGIHSYLLEEYERMRKNVSEMQYAKVLSIRKLKP
jgi:hypothetical protein